MPLKGQHAAYVLPIQAANAAKTQCVRGHPFDRENTYFTRKGYRRCRKCARAATVRWMAKVKTRSIKEAK